MDFFAFVLINTQTGKLDQVLLKLKEIEGIEETYPTTGPFDIITRLVTRNLAEIRKVVTTLIHNIDGVEKTTTCVVSE